MIALLAPATPAAADVSIGRANSEATDIEPAFINDGGAGTPGDVTVSGGRIYWVAGDAIARANLDGSDVDPDFITAVGRIGGLTADGQYLYWGGDAIGRARLDGTGVEPAFMAPSGGADDVAARPPYLYWTSDVGIGRANLDGTGADPAFIETGVTATNVPEPVFAPTDLAVNSARVFWSYVRGPGTSAIARANLDGGGVETVVSSSYVFHGDSFRSLAADDSRVFVRVSGGVGDSSIAYFDANASGTGCCLARWGTSFDLEAYDPFGGVAVDNGRVYWPHEADHALNCDFDGTKYDQWQLGDRVRFTVWFWNCERVTARVSGRARIDHETYKLKRKTVTVGGEGSADSLALRPRRKDSRAILSAMNPNRAAKADIRLKLTDPAGNSDVRAYSVRLSRP